jgi:hypothetical protein
MPFPALVSYATEDEYREHYRRCYVDATPPILTVDGVPVRFFDEVFDHAFFDASDRRTGNKDRFSIARAQRIDWIRFAIEEGGRVEYFEWTDDQGHPRRELLLGGAYLVVLQFRGKARNWAKFITAFLHDNPDRIRHDPNKRRVWPKKKE